MKSFPGSVESGAPELPEGNCEAAHNAGAESNFGRGGGIASDEAAALKADFFQGPML
jgi:hypothetical protein